MATIPITKRGAEILKAELHQLKTVERPTVRNRTTAHRATGRPLSACCDAVRKTSCSTTIVRFVDSRRRTSTPFSRVPSVPSVPSRRALRRARRPAAGARASPRSPSSPTARRSIWVPPSFGPRCMQVLTTAPVERVEPQPRCTACKCSPRRPPLVFPTGAARRPGRAWHGGRGRCRGR